ncbi:MAG: hypothetical protein CMB84_02240 [Flammeovirgaceae bacterium]|nr:hypothetical protein [Flammeovirgaceae bacterium]|tara:strand:+ start:119 stop:871 length:753 start_codon:yes stop_codon:yes gene_type:complete
MIFYLILISTLSINNIDEINRLTKEAELFFKNKEYEKSIINYDILIDSFEVSDEKVFLNLAHSHFLNGDTTAALENYNYTTITDNNKIKSIALQQIGNINNSKNKLEEALEFYKESIISDNNNLDSKFNYELVKRKIEDQNKNQEKDQNKDQNKEQEKEQEKSDNKKKDDKGQQDKDKDDKENDSKENKNNEQNSKKSDAESLEEKLKKINMSKKKAEMILDALNNNEFQYIQQLKRNPKKKKDNNKPDW